MMDGENESIEWNELLSMLLGYPSVSLHAEVGSCENRVPDRSYEVWRHGRKLRVEKDGSPEYICDGETYWSFGETEHRAAANGRPVSGPADRARYFGEVQHLCQPRQARDWTDGDFTAPDGPVTVDEFQRRNCWTVALKAPPRKIGPLRIWVDQESGYLLGQVNENPEVTDVGQWFLTPEIGVPLDDSLFTWDGPTLTKAEVQDMLSQEVRELEESQMRWFRDNVLSPPLTASTTVDLVPEQIRIEDGKVFGGTPGVFRFERTAASQGPDAVDGPAEPKRRADITWRSGSHAWKITFLSPEIIVDDQLRSEVQRRLSGSDGEGQ